VVASSRSEDELLQGLRLPERYRLGRHIATGGMASVWCAEDLVLGRNVAIKVLSERFARDHVAVARFEREARTAARVSGHPHVVTIYDIGEVERSDADAGTAPSRIPRTFIVMEHLAGGTVADAMRVGEVRFQEALRWLREAASALDHAHERGIVHRDIKPANFLLDGARVLHVADFGIARLGTEDTITSAGELFGTAAYLSPEQALGRAASAASDRYALAVAGYELLVGQRPFNATHFTAQARQHIEQPPPAASERNRVLPPAVDAVLQRGLAKQPHERYATAAEFVDDLDAALSQRRTHATNRRVTPATGRGGRGPRGRAIALGALATAALGVGALAAQTQGGGPGKPSASSQARAKQLASRTPVRRAPPATSSAPRLTHAADTLEAKGHQLMLAGAYSAAIPTLRRAVSVAPPESLTYGFALYDLGRSLVLSGNPKAAVPILERRLLIPNQTEVVQAMLQLALRATTGGTGITASSATTTSATSTTSTTSAPPPTTTTTATIQAPAAPSPPRHNPGEGQGRSNTGSGGAGLPVVPGQISHDRETRAARTRRERSGVKPRSRAARVLTTARP
jgi:tetratricopeptide (TPR) repeat protein